MNYKGMPNVSYHIAIQPKYRQNVVVSLRMNEKTPENITQLEMWANAQRDGRPAEHRWRPLFNAAKFG